MADKLAHTGSAADHPDRELIEKVVTMTEWETSKGWAYDGSTKNTPEEQQLAQAHRFVAAQSFILSWQNGKVPTGWRRPRKLTDFEGKYSQEILDAALTEIQRRNDEKNLSTTARIKELRRLASKPEAAKPPPKPISKAEIKALKGAYATFSSDLHDVRTALANASSTIAEIILRTEAVAKQAAQ